MAGWRKMGALLLAGALAMAGQASAESPGNPEYTSYQPVWLDGGMGFRRAEGPALLSMPPGWLAGDALAVLAPAEGWPRGQRDALVAALLDAGTAVMELNRPRMTSVAEDLASALRAARGAFGAGLIVLIGRGEAGAAALAIAEEAVDPGGRHHVAAIQLGPGAAGFRIGGVTELFAHPGRPSLLCDILAAAWVAGEPDVAAGCHAVAEEPR